MRHLLAIVFLLATGHVEAQTRIPTLAAGASYKGPGDLMPGASAWYGLRAYTAAAAHAGTKAINIRRASDNATRDILLLPSGALDVNTASSFCQSTSCFLTEAYDQTGNGNHAVQATAAAQPALTFNCLGSLPCMTFSGASSQQLVSSSGTLGGGGGINGTASTVAERTGTFTSFNAILSDSSGDILFLSSVASTADLGQGGSNITQAATDSAWHSIQGVMGGATANASFLDTDGTATATGTLANGASNLGNALTLGAAASSSFLTGKIAEGGFWPTQATSAVLKTVCHNQFAYWGTSVAC